MPSHFRKTILLAADQQQSVLNSVDSNEHRSIAYTPYGHRPRENGLLSLLGFNGELPDLLTGHYHLGNGYRQFNPTLMRFNSPDSWSPFGAGGLNAYVYCDGDPRNKMDQTGHTPENIKEFFRSLGLTSSATRRLQARPVKPMSASQERLELDFEAEINKRLEGAQDNTAKNIELVLPDNERNSATLQVQQYLEQNRQRHASNLANHPESTLGRYINPIQLDSGKKISARTFYSRVSLDHLQNAEPLGDVVRIRKVFIPESPATIYHVKRYVKKPVNGWRTIKK